MLAVTLYCRSWTCPDCIVTRTHQLMAEVIGGNPDSFLTITYRRRPGITPEQAALELSRSWRLLRLRIMRRFKLKHVPFMAVMEAHKSGWPHLHIALRMKFIPQRWISAQMKELTGSPNVWITRIKSKNRLARYVAPYCSKAAHKFGNAKRYWKSRDYDQREPADPRDRPAPGEGWELYQKPIEWLAKGWEELGYRLHWITDSKLTAEIVHPWDTT